MSYLAVSLLGAKMARRNHLYLFTWLCATVVPVLLQVISGALEEVRDFLMEYYGPISLYMYFTMTYGFATVFVSYYHVGSYRRAGTVDLLRVSQLTPREIVTGVLHRMELILVPPLLAFAIGFFLYARYFGGDSFIRTISWAQAIGFGGVMLLNQAVLASLPLLGLFRREESYALVSLVLVLPLNVLPLLAIVIFGRWLPDWAAVGLMILLLVLVLLGEFNCAVRGVTKLWLPQVVG